MAGRLKGPDGDWDRTGGLEMGGTGKGEQQVDRTEKEPPPNPPNRTNQQVMSSLSEEGRWRRGLAPAQVVVKCLS